MRRWCKGTLLHLARSFGLAEAPTRPRRPLTHPLYTL